MLRSCGEAVVMTGVYWLCWWLGVVISRLTRKKTHTKKTYTAFCALILLIGSSSVQYDTSLCRYWYQTNFFYLWDVEHRGQITTASLIQTSLTSTFWIITFFFFCSMDPSSYQSGCCMTGQHFRRCCIVVQCKLLTCQWCGFSHQELALQQNRVSDRPYSGLCARLQMLK